LDTDGRVLLAADGKRIFNRLITFPDTAGRDRWKHAVLTALADAGVAGGGNGTD
jgi:hypothetical protein